MSLLEIVYFLARRNREGRWDAEACRHPNSYAIHIFAEVPREALGIARLYT
jgi:hypothetical protein